MLIAPLVLLLASGAFLATMAGGLLAISLKDRLHLVLGFSAGAVVGVSFFDLMPEALETGAGVWDGRTILLIVAAGFFFYALVDRFVMLHEHGDDGHGHGSRGWLGASSFSAHSLLDGLAIGIAFHASRAVGMTVAVAVLVHDFSDGLNTVNVVVKNGGTRRLALRWLLMDAAAPVVGAALSLMLTLPPHALAPILAVFSGFFLYIGACDLLPESHHAHPRLFTTAATILGAATLWLATRLAG